MTTTPISSASETPILLIAFNRPDLTRRTLAAIREGRPGHLLLLCDGPRPDRPDDVARVAAVHEALGEIDWPCRIDRRFSEPNLGCERSVETGLDWAFQLVDRAIVLEDDCVPDPTFFPYAAELLDRYRDNQRVWHIAGNQHGVPTTLFGGHSYAFSTWASVWGWATWADRWQRHRQLFPRPDGGLPIRTQPAKARSGSLVTRSAKRHFADVASSDDVITHGWDKHWWLTIMSEGGLSTTPALNLVANVGFGNDATHAMSSRVEEETTAMSFPLRHPPRVTLSVEVERELELVLNRVGGRAAQLARRVVRSSKLRAVLRRAADSRPATAAARTASRFSSGS